MCIYRRMLKNKVKEVPEAKPPLNHPLRMTEQEKRESIHSINNAIGKLFYYLHFTAFHSKWKTFILAIHFFFFFGRWAWGWGVYLGKICILHRKLQNVWCKCILEVVKQVSHLILKSEYPKQHFVSVLHLSGLLLNSFILILSSKIRMETFSTCILGWTR